MAASGRRGIYPCDTSRPTVAGTTLDTCYSKKMSRAPTVFSLAPFALVPRPNGVRLARLLGDMFRATQPGVPSHTRHFSWKSVVEGATGSGALPILFVCDADALACLFVSPKRRMRGIVVVVVVSLCIVRTHARSHASTAEASL